MSSAVAIPFITIDLLGAACWVLVRPWGLRWGATDDEVQRRMPGDDFIREPNYVTTKAITIEAAPDAIWPWLVQIGRGRGGLYSFDFLDRLFGILDAPSATAILPQYQELRPGDAIPMKGGDWPVQQVESQRTLVLGDHIGADGGWSWEFGLYVLSDTRTRLVSRSRARTPQTALWRCALFFIDAAALVMTRQMLLNLKARVEGLTRRQ